MKRTENRIFCLTGSCLTIKLFDIPHIVYRKYIIVSIYRDSISPSRKTFNNGSVAIRFFANFVICPEKSPRSFKFISIPAVCFYTPSTYIVTCIASSKLRGKRTRENNEHADPPLKKNVYPSYFLQRVAPPCREADASVTPWNIGVHLRGFTWESLRGSIDLPCVRPSSFRAFKASK